MAEQPMIVVRGEAHREVPPEQAVFSVTTSARDRDRDAVLARVAERAAQLRTVVDSHQVHRRETGNVQVYPELKRGGEAVVAYTASVVTTVTVTEFDGLGEFLLRLARLDHAAVSGPWWQLRPGSGAEADVRRAAVADALRRARDYADAVGARLDRLVEIADESTGRPMGAAVAFALPASRPSAPELVVDPQPQTVSANVTVRLTITEPTLPN